MKRLTILGSTGSIGTQTLEVVRAYSKELEVTALAAGTNVELMEKQIREFHPKKAVMWKEEAAKELKKRTADLDVEIGFGMAGMLEISTLPETDIVLTAIVGMI